MQSQFLRSYWLLYYAIAHPIPFFWPSLWGWESGATATKSYLQVDWLVSGFWCRLNEWHMVMPSQHAGLMNLYQLGQSESRYSVNHYNVLLNFLLFSFQISTQGWPLPLLSKIIQYSSNSVFFRVMEVPFLLFRTGGGVRGGISIPVSLASDLSLPSLVQTWSPEGDPKWHQHQLFLCNAHIHICNKCSLLHGMVYYY